MSTAVKTVLINLGTDGGDPAFQVQHSAECPTNSFVNRFDIAVLYDSGKQYPFGFQVYCSDGSPPKPLRYSPAPDSGVSDSNIKRFQGPSVASGIDDLAIRHSKAALWVSQFGYAGITVPATVAEVNRNDPVWRQASLEETGVGTGCKLKGVNIWAAEGWIDRLYLNFDCPLVAQPTMSLSFGSIAPTPLSQSDTNTLSIPTPTTTTLTIGSGSQLTTFVTVVTPGVPPQPFTVTLPGGDPVIVTQLPGSVTLSTILATRDMLAGRSGPSDGLLIALIIALSLLSAALAALLMYIRMRVRDRPIKEQPPPLPLPPPPSPPLAIELADLVASPSPGDDVPWSDVDPPAYLVVAIPDAGPVEHVPQELVGTERRGAPDKKEGVMGEETVESAASGDEDLYLPCSSSFPLKR